MQQCWWDKFSLEDLGPWPFVLRGINTGSSWTRDPLLLKGFWCSSSHHVLVLWFCAAGMAQAWFWMQLEVSSPLSMCQLHDLWFWPVVPQKQTQYPVKEVRTMFWFCGYNDFIPKCSSEKPFCSIVHSALCSAFCSSLSHCPGQTGPNGPFLFLEVLHKH